MLSFPQCFQRYRGIKNMFVAQWVKSCSCFVQNQTCWILVCIVCKKQFKDIGDSVLMQMTWQRLYGIGVWWSTSNDCYELFISLCMLWPRFLVLWKNVSNAELASVLVSLKLDPKLVMAFILEYFNDMYPESWKT